MKNFLKPTWLKTILFLGIIFHFVIRSMFDPLAEFNGNYTKVLVFVVFTYSTVSIVTELGKLIWRKAKEKEDLLVRILQPLRPTLLKVILTTVMLLTIFFLPIKKELTICAGWPCNPSYLSIFDIFREYLFQQIKNEDLIMFLLGLGIIVFYIVVSFVVETLKRVLIKRKLIAGD